MNYRLGIDIGGTKIRSVVLDENGRIAFEHSIPTRAGIAALTELLREVRKELGRAEMLSDLASVGVGIPGIVDDRTGRVQGAVNVGLHDEPFGALVADLFALSTAVENDVSVAALGAWEWAGHPSSLGYLNLGTGLGVGTIINGELLRGSRGAAGEIGHLPVDPDGPACGCGQRGCLELYLSGSGLARQWPATKGHSAQYLLQAARAGDPDALDAYERYVSRLAWAVQQIAVSTDPELIVIGGGISALGDALLSPVLDRLKRNAEGSPFVSALELPSRLRMLPLGHPAAAVGAAIYGQAARSASEHRATPVALV